MRHWHNHFREARDVGLEEIISLVSRYNNNPDPAGRKAQIWMWGGHGDEFPQDLDILTFDICGTCLKGWVEGFKHTQQGGEP